MTAEPQRQMRLLHWLGLHRDLFKTPIAPLEAGLLFGPEQRHDLYCFAKTCHASLARVTKYRFMRTQMSTAEADSHDRPPAAHDIQSCIGLRQLHRIAQGQKNHGRA